MEKEFYLGYLRNPKDVITNGFQDIKESVAILYKYHNDYYEVVTNEKVFIADKNQVFDGHQVKKNHCSLIGRIEKKLDKFESNKFINAFNENNIVTYLENINHLLVDTKEKAEIGYQEYLEKEQEFKNSFKKK